MTIFKGRDMLETELQYPWILYRLEFYVALDTQLVCCSKNPLHYCTFTFVWLLFFPNTHTGSNVEFSVLHMWTVDSGVDPLALRLNWMCFVNCPTITHCNDPSASNKEICKCSSVRRLWVFSQTLVTTIKHIGLLFRCFVTSGTYKMSAKQC